MISERLLSRWRALERKVQEGDQRVSQLQKELSDCKRESQPKGIQGSLIKFSEALRTDWPRSKEDSPVISSRLQVGKRIA